MTVMERRWRAAILIEGSPKQHPNEFKRKWDLFFQAIQESRNHAIVEGSTGTLRTSPDVYRAEIVFHATDDTAANQEATRLIETAAAAAEMPHEWSRVMTVYEWPEGLPLR